ncbi:glycoside hydrolase family 13 protein [Synechococcus sp. M16CYN]
MIYQIFPDRFRRSNRVETQKNLFLKSWGSNPEDDGFQGGDLYGVIDGLDHLQAMGINCIYLTPIFSSAANHRYHVYDYFQVDPLLGGNAALISLITEVHQRDMRLVLDGVFNHCGRGFWAFHHLAENGKSSPYRSWFHVHQWPIRPYPSKGEDCGYKCWWGLPGLPKFNHADPGVREYLLAVGRYWLECGIDGWRLDDPAEVPEDFWVAFRQEVRKVNSQAWILGEIWGDARPWLQGEHFDSVTNYRLGWSSLCWAAGDRLCQNYQNPEYPLSPISGKKLIEIWHTTAGWYRPEINRAQMNLLDSHDVPRALHTLQGDVKALKLSLLLLFLHPGAPCIYYGTEIGLNGGPNASHSNGPEPYCREAFPWDQLWDVDLCNYVRRLKQLRDSRLNCGQGPLVWQVAGLDSLVASSVGWQIWINRSRESGVALPKQTEIQESFCGTCCDGTLGVQSAVLITATNCCRVES